MCHFCYTVHVIFLYIEQLCFIQPFHYKHVGMCLFVVAITMAVLVLVSKAESIVHCIVNIILYNVYILPKYRFPSFHP